MNEFDMNVPFVMNREVKKKWIAALLSRKYKQGRHALRVGDRYCCLGVLCELAVEAEVISPPVKWNSRYAYDNRAELLPEAVQEWAGLYAGYGANLTIHGKLTDLITHNDSGRRFTTIAKAIQEQL